MVLSVSLNTVLLNAFLLCVIVKYVMAPYYDYIISSVWDWTTIDTFSGNKLLETTNLVNIFKYFSGKLERLSVQVFIA
jgi:hypothetical protein